MRVSPKRYRTPPDSQAVVSFLLIKAFRQPRPVAAIEGSGANNHF